MFFNSIKYITRLRKEINRLLGKRMSNIYLKVTIEKKSCNQNFDFKSPKVRVQVSFWGDPTDADVTKFSNLLLQLQSQRYVSKNMRGFSIIFILKGIMTL